MAIETDEDRLVLLEDLGDSVLYNGLPVNAVFGNEYFEARMGDFGTESSSPGILCRSSDTAGAAHGDSVVVGGVQYMVVGVQPDGIGMTEFVLEKV